MSLLVVWFHCFPDLLCIPEKKPPHKAVEYGCKYIAELQKVTDVVVSPMVNCVFYRKLPKFNDNYV